MYVPYFRYSFNVKCSYYLLGCFPLFSVFLVLAQNNFVDSFENRYMCFINLFFLNNHSDLFNLFITDYSPAPSHH